MKLKKLNYRLRRSCSKCPYMLGQVHTLSNPCPQCSGKGYQIFEQFQKKLLENNQGRV